MEIVYIVIGLVMIEGYFIHIGFVRMRRNYQELINKLNIYTIGVNLLAKMIAEKEGIDVKGEKHE